MLPDRVSNPGPLTYESGALPIALHGPARFLVLYIYVILSVPKVHIHDLLFTYLFSKIKHYLYIQTQCSRYKWVTGIV